MFSPLAHSFFTLGEVGTSKVATPQIGIRRWNANRFKTFRRCLGGRHRRSGTPDKHASNPHTKNDTYKQYTA